MRLLAATNRDLAAEVKAGHFREDLVLSARRGHRPRAPLRERAEDIPLLVDAFVRTYAERYDMGRVEVDPALAQALAKHPWPGNVRELENTIARLLAIAPDDKLTLALWEGRSSAKAGFTTDPGPGHPLRRRIETFERAIIAEQFEASGKNQSETARRLGISRAALIEKLHKYGLVGDA